MKFNNSKIVLKDMENVEKGIGKMVTSMGILAINHYKQSFRNEGFTDYDLKKWEARSSKRDNKDRAILYKTGKLKRSLIYRKVSRISVRISSNVPYALVHNEGLTINKKERSHVLNFNKKGRLQRQRTESQRNKTAYSQKVNIGAHSFKMPKRKFVGYSSQLAGKIEMMFEKRIKAIFK